jgi:predicted ATPase
VDIVSNEYNSMVKAGDLSYSASQLHLTQRMDKLAERLHAYETVLETYHVDLLAHESHLTSSKSEALPSGNASDVSIPVPPVPPPVPRGLYIHGSVGSGKSMLLDLLFDSVQCRGKARFHFHDFMAMVHAQLHAYNQHRLAASGRLWHVSSNPEDDSVVAVGRKLAHEHWLVAFDEFQVTDVADALIMSRLFSAMWAQGAVVIATSNRPPQQLYVNGLNRELFLPFVGALQTRCRSVQLRSEHDWRHAHPETHAAWAVSPAAGKHSPDLPLDQAPFKSLGLSFGGSEMQAHEVHLGGGRSVSLLAHADSGTLAATYTQLCDSPISPADFKKVLSGASALVLAGVPIIAAAHSDCARRLIHLVDQAYEARVPLLVTAEGPAQAVLSNFTGHKPATIVRQLSSPEQPHSLDPAGVSHISEEAEAAAIEEIGFAASRALSRLHEMRTDAFRGGAVATRTRQRLELARLADSQSPL